MQVHLDQDKNRSWLSVLEEAPKTRKDNIKAIYLEAYQNGNIVFNRSLETAVVSDESCKIGNDYSDIHSPVYKVNWDTRETAYDRLKLRVEYDSGRTATKDIY